jgi:hypothetical protein
MEENRSPALGEGANSSGLPLIIGWREYVGLPDWGIRRIKVKVDTGARTSALDVAGYELRHVAGQGLVAELRLLLDRKNRSNSKVVQWPVLEMVAVRNSSGLREQRPLVETTLRLGPVVKRVRLTITNRSSMRFRMILGRKALENDFIVDVSKQYLLR